MRANPETKHFFQQVQALMVASPGFNDQEAINKLLHDNSLVVWRYLPPDFYARSHGWPPREKILLYHANCTAGSNGVRQKLKQFSDYRKLQLYGRPFAIYAMFRRKIHKSLSRSIRKFAR